MNILHAVNEAGAGFRSIAEPTLDTTSQLAEVVIAVLGVPASYERQPTRSAPASAAPRPRRAGSSSAARAPHPAPAGEARHKLDVGDTQRTVAALFNVSQATISRLQSDQGGVPNAETRVAIESSRGNMKGRRKARGSV